MFFFQKKVYATVNAPNRTTLDYWLLERTAVNNCITVKGPMSIDQTYEERKIT